MKLRLALSLAALLAGSCATHVTGGVYPADGGYGPAEDAATSDARGGDIAWTPVDLIASRDLRESSPDLMSRPRDMATAGKTCGEIVLCAVNCGLQVSVCQLQCLQGASGQALTDAANLIACGVKSCLGQDAGGTQGMLTCMILSCTSEIGKCGGLGF